MTKYNKKIIVFAALAVFLVSLILLLLVIGPEEIVNKIGVRNGYIIIFIVSLFGGFSAGGSISFITLLITFTAGGLNPVALGLISGTSLAIGDMVMFYAGSKGRELIRGKWDKKIDKVANVFNKKKWLKKLAPFLAYLYMGFAPLPNDVLLLFLAAIKFPAKKMNVIIILGDLTFALTLTLLVARGFIL
ncbi:hypothetical protein COB64_01835 [Candidatus Wolfebacteria bacterium]|nr:MAG: hypothetical protein COB64_01835 [Candidatus Wolfebacteria bacterium]